MPFPPTARKSSCSVKDNIIPHIYTTYTHPVQRETSAGTGVYESILIITIKPTFPAWNRPLTKKQVKKAPRGWYTSSQHPVGFIILPKERCWSVKPTQNQISSSVYRIWPFQDLFRHQIYLACCAFGDQLFKFQWLGTLRAVNCFVGVLHAIYPLLVDTRSTISCCQKYLSTLKTILMEQYHFFALQIRIEFIHKSVKWTLFTCCSWIICHMVFTPNSMDSKFQLSLQWIGVLTDGFLQVL